MTGYTELEQRREDIEAKIKQALCTRPIGRGQAARDRKIAELYLQLAENLTELEKLAYNDRGLHLSFVRIISYARNFATGQARWYQGSAAAWGDGDVEAVA